MSISQDNRISYYDNLRFFLIATVVIGHFIDPITSQSDICKSIFLWIYSFHMPLFLFLSGMFHKNKNIVSKITQYIIIGFVFLISIFLVDLMMTGKTSLSYFGTNKAPWYMFVLAAYTALSYFFRNMDKRFILVFAIIIALFSGYDSSLGDMFYASRIIVFYPFFVLGEMSSSGELLKIVSKKWVRALGIVMLVLWGALCIFKLDSLYILRTLFTGRNPFGNKYGAWAFLYRGACYIITMFVGFGVMCLVPQRKLPVITRFGSRTLQIYFWHVIVRDIFVNLQLHKMLGTTPLGKIVLLLIAVVCTFILGFKIFGFPTTQIVNACRNETKTLKT